MKKVIGIDIGGTNLRIGLVDNYDDVENFQTVSSKFIEKENGLEQLYLFIKSYVNDFTTSEDEIEISMGVPSVVSLDKSFVYSTPNLKGVDNMDLGHFLTKKLGLKVLINRDVNNLLLHDIRCNKLDPERNKTIVGIYVGTGLGNAVYIDGEIFKGKNGAAGELGHIPLYGVSDICTCGKKGCAETRMSGKYLEKLVEENFPDTFIKKVFVEKGDTKLIQEFIINLALPIATEINILDPHYVVLAGGVLGMEKFPIKLLLKSIKENLRTPFPASNIQYVFPTFSQKNGVLGAAYSIFKK